MADSLGVLVARLAQLSPADRRALVLTLPERQVVALREHLRTSVPQIDRSLAVFADDPVEFVVRRLGESVWSKQAEILRSVVDHQRTAVPACHAPGKSHIAARAVAHMLSTYPLGSALAITTAPTFRQVRSILWPHIRKAHRAGRLPGTVLTTEWKAGTDLIAFGFSARDNDEAAVQGIHAEHLLLVVDEAGGISHALGQAFESMLTTAFAHILAIGNPPTDEEGSWFQTVCESPLWNVIPIPASATPNFTDEGADLPDSVTSNLVQPGWVDDIAAQFGEDSPFYVARVLARFPRVVANAVIPVTWVEAAQENDDPEPRTAIKLGVDVAADGGDELAIARLDGNVARVVFTSQGEANARPHDVAGYVLRHIEEAEELRRQAGVTEPVRVKIDSIGIGWGVAGILQAWRDEGIHDAVVVAVNVSESAGDPDHFGNQRAEMWWAGRQAFQPRPPEVPGDPLRAPALALDVDLRTKAQLSAPTYHTDSQGRIRIEAKEKLKKRGRPSPDRAEAVLLAIYEPPSKTVDVEVIV